MRWYAEIAFRFPKFTCPPPNASEHAAMQTFQKPFSEYVMLPAKSPCIGCRDVPLFGLIQFAPRRDVARYEAVAFGGRQRCGMIVSGMRVGHFSSQRRAGRRSSSSMACRR